MPIENLDKQESNNQLAVQHSKVFETNNTVTAGFLVKHPLYDCKLLLIGFCEMEHDGLDEFHATGKLNEIGTIYPKLVIDLKKSEPIKYLNYKRSDNYNYYLFDNISDEFAITYSDNIYAVCKYKEDGLTKYDIFSLYEITPDI